MKVLTAAEMREVDRRTIEAGIPGIVLMENAAHRVVEAMAERFAPFEAQRIVVLCGKGNNGGDGLAIARQLRTRFRPAALDVVLFAAPEEMKGDAAANYRMWLACGGAVESEIPARARLATVVVDALLGTGISGPATGRMLDAIREINTGFPLAKVVAVDIPSGMPSDSGEPAGEFARADLTVTFTALKIAQAMPPNCDHMGELVVGAIGSPEALYDQVWLSQVEPSMFRGLLAPRPRGGHKGTFGHALILAGSPGKTGAAAMAGLATLRAGAGLVTVVSDEKALPQIAGHAPELMTAPLHALTEIAENKTVIGMGPGLGHSAVDLSRRAAGFGIPMVVDADALTSDLGRPWPDVAILTPHPGEMARLTGMSTADVQKDRIAVARAYAQKHRVTLVLKGERTVIAFRDGRVWINPTGTPALGTGGAGDILTGLITGLLAQFPDRADEVVAAAVYLGGLAAEIAVCDLGEKSLIATDLLRYLPRAIAECQ
jgi:ADP-dependent NAD(P)H-hydrate dehydratase / NAD(P)H-hydrate epimerase